VARAISSTKAILASQPDESRSHGINVERGMIQGEDMVGLCMRDVYL